MADVTIPTAKATGKPQPNVPVRVERSVSKTTVSSNLALSPDMAKSRRSLKWTTFLIALIAVACSALGYLLIHKPGSHAAVESAVTNRALSAAAEEPSQTMSISSHLMFVGDVFWGRAIETAAQRSGKGAGNLFRGLTADDKKGFDAWVGDMECPVTNKDIPYRTQVDNLIFNCRPEYAMAAAQWFDVMTLANNHTDNNGGAWGLDQTRANLEAAGIQYFGTYNMKDESDICEVVSVKARPTSGEPFMIPVAMCGYDYVGNVTPQASQLQQMQRYAKVMPVFAMPHMGIEYRPTAEDAKVRAYRQLIDNGADVVIGAHPHVVQNTEVYKGRLIAYSVGNFLFDQQILGRDTTETLGVGVSITVQDPTAVAAYEKIGARCKTFKDDCLAQLEEAVTKRPVIQVAYDFQCFDESSGTPVKATPAVCDQIKARATISGLQGLATTW